MSHRTSLQKALQSVRDSGDGLYGVVLENGTMELGFYRPSGTDLQSPHTQDEIYIVQSGTGLFVRDDKTIEFAAGDALFVAAGVPHRFTEFSEDFAAWVIFYGPEGGES